MKRDRAELLSITWTIFREITFFIEHLGSVASLWCIWIDEEFMLSLIIARREKRRGRDNVKDMYLMHIFLQQLKFPRIKIFYFSLETCITHN